MPISGISGDTTCQLLFSRVQMRAEAYLGTEPGGPATRAGLCLFVGFGRPAQDLLCILQAIRAKRKVVGTNSIHDRDDVVNLATRGDCGGGKKTGALADERGSYLERNDRHDAPEVPFAEFLVFVHALVA